MQNNNKKGGLSRLGDFLAGKGFQTNRNMRKLLLMFFCLLTVSITALAEETTVTIDFTQQGWTSGIDLTSKTLTSDGVTVSFAKNDGTSKPVGGYPEPIRSNLDRFICSSASIPL